jgi:replication factor C small subunit
MTELENILFTEKYRPKKFEDLILGDKDKILSYLKTPETLPSFIFYSPSPGTGKTTTAKLIAESINSDFLKLNASDERGIDTIRDKIKMFCTTLSTNGIKRCIFLDEAEGLTKPAQDSLKSIIEEYSGNCFFIFTTNDISRIIEPIRSRCVLIHFERPNKEDILARVLHIVGQEGIEAHPDEIEKVIEALYPDIRAIILLLQDCKINNLPLSINQNEYIAVLETIKSKNYTKMYEIVYSGKLDILGFNRWMFKGVFQNFNKLGIEKASKIATLLADIEKAYEINVNLEIVFLANMLEISKIW